MRAAERRNYTFDILALKKERTRNLNRSSSVCRMTRVKLDLGSAVPVMSSIVSIYGWCGQHLHTALRAFRIRRAYLLLDPLHHAIN